MEQNQKLLDLTNVSPWVKIAEHVYRVKVSPFCYKGEKKKDYPENRRSTIIYRAM